MCIRNELFQSSWNVMSKEGSEYERRKRKEKIGKKGPPFLVVFWWLRLGNFPLICPNLKLKKRKLHHLSPSSQSFPFHPFIFLIFLLGIKTPAWPCPPPVAVTRTGERRDVRVADVNAEVWVREAPCPTPSKVWMQLSVLL